MLTATNFGESDMKQRFIMFRRAGIYRFTPYPSLQASSQGNRMMAMTARPSPTPAEGALQNEGAAFYGLSV
jgi:hypothetical protein